jgi:Family of unknown function (DUF6049)
LRRACTALSRRACIVLAAGLTLGAVLAGTASTTSSASTASSASSASTASSASSASTASSASASKAAGPARSGQASGSPVSVTVTHMTPQWATPKARITVTGTVTDLSKDPITDLSVLLEASSQPFASAATLQSYLGDPYEPSGSQLMGHRAIPGTLQPGQSATWSIRFQAKAAGMTTFGVYPLTAVVNADVPGSAAPALNYGFTLLPYIPARHTADAHSIPASTQVAWVLPLIDSPLIALPGHRDCSGPQAAALGRSLEPGGRLASLLAAGVEYGKQDQLTWAVDPALLSDVRSLSHCANVPGAAKAAASWLTTLRTATAGAQLFATPYGDVDPGLISQRHSLDVQRAFTIGSDVATAILHRNLKPPAASAAADATPSITTMEWPPDGTAEYSTVENMAGVDDVQSVLLSSSVNSGSGTSFLTDNGIGGLDHVLLYSDALNRLLGSATTAPGSEFATAQDFLAVTALLAQQDPAAPIVVAPPQRWQAPGGLAATVLAETHKAPWLKSATLAGLESHATRKLTLPDSPGARAFSRPVLRELSSIDSQIDQLAGIENTETQSFGEAAAALESSAWHSLSRRKQLAMSSQLLAFLQHQEHGVSLVVTPRVTLGGLKGDVSVGIDSSLGYPITVRLSWSFDQPPDGGSLRLSQQPSGPITVAPYGQQPVKLRVDASQVGSTTITLRLLSGQGSKPLPASTAVTVQATQFGNLAMIILAAALGLFVIASGIRAARRGHPSPPDDSGAPGQLDRDADLPAQEPAETDTVVPEHSELGTAGTSGL